MDHPDALLTLLAFAERPGAPPPALERALDHVATCPACAAGARQLLAALGAAAEDRLTCAEAEELLPEFLAAPGGAAAPAWADLRAHLACCPACLAALADLALLRDLAEGAGVEPPAYPAPPPAPRAWSVDALGRLLVDLARALLPPAGSPALAGLKSGPAGATLAEASVAGALPDLELHIAVEGRPGSDLRTLVVTVDIPSRGGWPNLAGSEVALLHAGVELRRAATDAFGTVAFHDLSAEEVARLSLVVLPRG